MATPAVLADNDSVLMILALADTDENISPLRLSNTVGVTQTGVAPVTSPPGIVPDFDGANDALYDDRIVGPVELQSRISIEQYGSVIKGTEAVGGSVDIAIGASVASLARSGYDFNQWLQMLWKGRNALIYRGPTGSMDYDDYEPIYQGIIDDLSFTDNTTATVKLGGMSRLADAVLVTELYIDGADPDFLVGKPKPNIWGYVKYHQPVLYDEATQTYHIATVSTSDPAKLAAVENVTVGGIPWVEVVTLDPDITGQYTVDLVNGTMQLSGAPGNLELRCDVKAYGWGTLTVAELIRQWIAPRNITHDVASFTQLDTDIPYLIGYATGLDPVNTLDAIDEVCVGHGALYTESDFGEIKLHAIDAPSIASDDSTYDLDMSGVNADGVVSFKLNRILPRVHTINCEYDRVWSPLSNFAEVVTEEVQTRYKGPGLTVTPIADTGLESFDPSAISLPMVRTMTNSPADANAIGLRLADAYSPERRIYEVELTTETGLLYSTIKVNGYAGIVNKMFRITSILRQLGGGRIVAQIWG